MSVYRRTLNYFRPSLRQAAVATGITLWLTPFMLRKPWPFAFIIAKVLAAAAGNGEHLKVFFRGVALSNVQIITHRIATVHDMEKILVLRLGEIGEIGTGLELVTRGGVYAQLYRAANLH
jgi:hypothetical protein